MEKKKKITKDDTVPVRLTPQMKEIIEDLVSNGVFANNSDYVRFLIMDDLKKRGKI